MFRFRGVLAPARRVPRGWFGRVEAHSLIDALAWSLMAASAVLLGSLVV
jgi:hypothetical protein